ncbi:MAG: DUF413 domain-containing protein [Kiritimatiellaeota bacterium]|nr:DUF413 domain-containing protein [Kiritimatiellota bacterium]
MNVHHSHQGYLERAKSHPLQFAESLKEEIPSEELSVLEKYGYLLWALYLRRAEPKTDDEIDFVATVHGLNTASDSKFGMVWKRWWPRMFFCQSGSSEYCKEKIVDLSAPPDWTNWRGRASLWENPDLTPGDPG